MVTEIVYEAHYAKTADMTFIVMTEWGEDDELIAEEIVGFYHGEPNEESTEYR